MVNYDPAFNLVHRNASPIIWALAEKIHADAPENTFWLGRGYDPGSDEHATGRALDAMIASRVGRLPTLAEKVAGERLVQWLIDNGDELHLYHLIWDERIYKHRFKAWFPIPKTKSRIANPENHSDWHRDHVHILLADRAGRIPQSPIMGVSHQEETMDEVKLVETFMEFKITANGETLSFKDHFAKLLTYTKAQSVAVSTEVARDNKQFNMILTAIQELKAQG